ncbi:LOG family protein [Acidimangrovimonas sediminis]|uniref:LOG family protein n=1 Tax=Acidimangrovimonas sediminis TaxID=2056283 RepID=UPI000C7FE6D9|nr:TIGR00730 family Rossman fold protein [Acidimangrovimonas sediminis]
MPLIPASVCVFCGSRPGARPAYAAAARDLGARIAAEGWRLVYGAGDVGLMGEVARATQSAGGATFGVIPEHLLNREVGKRDLSTFVVTENMHERKKVMYMNSDAIVVLPGGAGSLDEFFEVLTWRQLGLHAKPVLLLDTEGYWQPLEGLMDHVIAEGFADASLKDYVGLIPDVDSLVEALRTALSRATVATE